MENRKRKIACSLFQYCLLGALFSYGTAYSASAQNAAPPPKNLTLLGIPSATVAPAGLGFVSLALTSRRYDDPDSADGSMALGFGLGSPEEGIGVQVTGIITSLTDDFADSGYFQLKASRRVQAGPAPVYVGASLGHLANWGDSRGSDVTGTLTVTRFSQFTRSDGMTHPIMATLGAGSGVRNNGVDPGVFFGVGVGLTPVVGASAAWTGDGLDVGVALRPPGSRNMQFTLTVNDVFDNDDQRRVTGSVNLFTTSLFSR